MPELAKLKFCRLVLPLLCRTPMTCRALLTAAVGAVLLVDGVAGFGEDFADAGSEAGDGFERVNGVV